MDWKTLRILFPLLSLVLTSLFAQSGGGPGIDPRAMETLKKMSNLLAATPAFGFTAEETYDEYDGNQMLQFGNLRSVAVRRPDRIVADTTGDTVNRSAWFDGKTFSLLDKEHNIYSSADIPGTIDELLDRLDEQFEVVIPLGELISADLHAQLTQQLQGASYIGLNQVGGTPCHHLAFRLDLLDFQLWLEAGESPLPRKLVITYKQEPGMPQYTAVFGRWNLKMETPDSLFEFEVPAGAREINWTVPDLPSDPDQN